MKIEEAKHIMSATNAISTTKEATLSRLRLIDKIYNSFNNRSCKDCIKCDIKPDGGNCGCLEYYCTTHEIMVDIDFACNSWKSNA